MCCHLRVLSTFFAHAVLEISTEKEWYNLLEFVSEGRLEQVARVLATQRQEKLSVNRLGIFIETII